MPTQYDTASSLDGFIATEDDDLAWLFPLGDVGDTGCPDFIRSVGARPMGASTCTWMLGESIVRVGSVTRGAGKPLLPRRTVTPTLRLTAVRAIGAGFAELRDAVPRA